MTEDEESLRRTRALRKGWAVTVAGIVGVTLGVAWASGCDGDVSSTGTGAGGSGGAGVGGSGGLGPCVSDADCGMVGLCDFPDDRCGAGEAGTCADMPGGCSTGTGPYPLVCGCDGGFHGTDCISADGTDLSVDAAACGAPPMGVFACGRFFCQSDYFYCQLTPGTGGAPDDGACIVRDSACTTCACITPTCAGGTCMETGGNLVVTCPAQ